jgi:DNA repair photolyase
MIPGINDAELERILATCANAGATRAGYVLLRLPLEIAGMFEAWLRAHFPDRAARVLALVRETRAGALYDSRFGHRQSGTGPYADMLAQRFRAAVARLRLDRANVGTQPLDCAQFAVPDAPSPMPKRGREPEAQLALL